MPRNIRWDESVLDNVLNLVGALLQLSEQQSDKSQPKPQLYVQWDSDKLRVTGYETKQTNAKISRTVEVGTKKEHLLKLVKHLKLPQRRTESGSSQQDKELQEVQYIFDSLRELKILVKDETTKPGYWKFTLTLKHQTATKEENLAVIKQKWEEYPKNIKKNSYASSQHPEAINDSIDWREVCTAMLQNQQEAARLRRKATEQGFEVNVYVPLGLVERKQQQRRQPNEQPDRANVYDLTQEVIVKTYEHGAFLREVIAQQPAEKNKNIAIIGEPGAGKTTLLSTIAAFIQNNTQDLPICISLANLQGKTIEEYLLKQWLTEAMRLFNSEVVVTPEIECQLIECFGKERVWLLLDGVDEMGENSPVQALTKINRELTASLRQARVVLTCRLNVWDAQVNNTLTGFDTYKTQEFKPEQIDDFIQQWFERAGDLPKGKTLQDKLKATQHENIRKLVTNPLRLSLLCQTFYLDKQGELPETKAALYQKFTRYFYEWKSELFPELCNSGDLKDELHCALSKLAFAGINSPARFRLPSSLARQAMGERLFKLACDVGWLNLVDRLAETDEKVYAFFHPNFQEYFAALNVKDWHEFLNHVPNNPTQGTYRIFEPQWKEVILLWFGQREEGIKQQQQEFINALVNFKDGCGTWDKEDVDKGFYEYQAYFLAAVGIAEFKDCSQADEIVKQIVKWGCGYSSEQQERVKFLEKIQDKARSTLQQTEKTKSIAALVQLLQSSDVDDDTRWQAAYSLGEIGTGNQNAIAALVQLLQSKDVDDDIRRLAAESLGKIDPGNENAIAALVQLLQSKDVYNYIRRRAAESLGKIGTGNENAIAALVQLLQSSDVDDYTRCQAASSLGEIDPGNQDAIAALVQLLQSSDVDDDTRWQAASSLGKIGTGNQNAIAALVQLLQSSDVDDYTRRQAAASLGKIGTGNQDAIAALVQLLQSSDVDDYTRRQAAASLGKIGTGNQDAIAALVQLLQSKDVYNYIRRRAAESLGKIGTGNENAIAALVQLLQSSDVDDYTRCQAASSLGEIDPGNQDAIAALVQLLHSSDVDDDTRWQAASSLGKIGTGNQNAIAALVQLLHSSDVDDYTRCQAASSLGQIDPRNQDAIAALVQLLHSSDVDDYTRWQAASSLGKIGTGNQNAIAALVQLLHSSDVDDYTRWQAAYSLGEIGTGNQNAIAALVQLLHSSDVDDDTRWQAASSLGKIGTGNQNAIAALVQLLQSSDVDDDTRREAAYSLGEIGTGNPDAIAALVQLLQSSDVDDDTRREAAYSLGEIGTGNPDAIAALVQLLQSSDVDDYTRSQAADSLGKVIQDNQHRSLAVTGLKDYLQFADHYNVIWECSQNMPYPNFYLAWHQRNSEEISPNHLDLPQRLQTAINKDSQLSQKIHLICIDTSQFIEPDNPAAEIYAEMVSQGCPERTSGEPNNMSALKVYFKLLKTDKRVVLVFHPGATNTTGEATYSKAFLNAISKFEGTICLISDPIPNYNTFKVFTPNQSVHEILEWLRRS